MTDPKMLPCPDCGSTEHLAVNSYDHGWRHVECDNRGCLYLGPGEGSIRSAIIAHNEGVAKDRGQTAALQSRPAR